MQLRKLFFADTEQSLRPRHRLGAEYLEGRGLYPEERVSTDHSEYDIDPQYDVEPLYDVEFEDQPEQVELHDNNNWQHDEINWHQSDERVASRRLPLTTLDALVQIKVNGLTHGNA